MGAIGLPLIVILLITWLADKKRRQQHLIIIFAGTSCMATLMFVIGSSITSEQKRFCRDNAVALNADDGPTVCGAQSIIIAYSALACTLAWMCIAVDLALKLVFEMKTVGHWKVINCCFTILICAMNSKLDYNMY